MSYFVRKKLIPDNQLVLRKHPISASDIWNTKHFGNRGLASVPIMAIAKGAMDAAMILYEELMPQDARAPKDILNWIQEDADDFSRTITSRLGQVDWSRVGSVALWSALRGAIDQLTLVLIQSTISAVFKTEAPELVVATLIHRYFCEVRDYFAGGYLLLAFPHVPKGGYVTAQMVAAGEDEVDVLPDMNRPYEYLFGWIRKPGTAYAEQAFGKYLLLHAAPYLVGTVIEYFRWMNHEQTIDELFLRLGDGLSRRLGGALGAAFTMGVFAPTFPIFGGYRSLLMFGFDYAGHYIGSTLGTGLYHKFFGKPKPYRQKPKAPAKAIAGAAARGSKAAVAEMDGEENGEPRVQNIPRPSRLAAMKNSRGAAASAPASNGRTSPPIDANAPTSSGRTTPPVRSVTPPPRAVTPPAASSDVPQSRAAARLAKIRGIPAPAPVVEAPASSLPVLVSQSEDTKPAELAPAPTPSDAVAAEEPVESKPAEPVADAPADESKSEDSVATTTEVSEVKEDPVAPEPESAPVSEAVEAKEEVVDNVEDPILPANSQPSFAFEEPMSNESDDE